MNLSAGGVENALEWVKMHGPGEGVSRSDYLIGFGLANDDQIEESRQTAINNARRHAAEQIFISLKGESKQYTEQINDKIRQFLSVATETYTAIEIEGLETEEFYDKKSKIYYARAYAEKAKLIASYARRLKELRWELRRRIDDLKTARLVIESAGKLKEINSARELSNSIINSKMILIALSGRTDFTESTDDIMMADSVETLAMEYSNRMINNPEALAIRLAEQFSSDSISSIPVVVMPISYQDTKMVSRFGRLLKSLIEAEMTRLGWRIQFTPQANSGEKDQLNSQQGRLMGSYWERGDRVRLFCILDVPGATWPQRTYEGHFPLSSFDTTQYSLRPLNYLDNLFDKGVFDKNEVTGGGLLLDVWTNKEDDNNYFEDGDTMRLFIRVNLPCFLRLVYHQADRRRALLLDNEPIDREKVNRVYQYPVSFIASPPLGAESLQCFAKTEKFDPLNTSEIDGVDIIVEDAISTLSKTRAMKPISLTGVNALIAEKRLTITTDSRSIR